MDKTIKCPNCGEAFDNIENEFLECSHCGKKYKNPFYKPHSNKNLNTSKQRRKLNLLKTSPKSTTTASARFS